MYSVQSLNHLAFVHSGKNHTVCYSNRKEEWFKWTCFHFGFRETILASSWQCISVFLVVNKLVNIGFFNWLKIEGYRLWWWEQLFVYEFFIFKFWRSLLLYHYHLFSRILFSIIHMYMCLFTHGTRRRNTKCEKYPPDIWVNRC